MIDILFKAKTIENKWVEGLLSRSIGCLNQPEKGFYISNKAGSPWAYHVRPETICIYSTFKDMDGNKAFSGDIVRFVSILSDAEIFEKPIIFEDGLFCAEGSGILCHLGGFLIIGNIFDKG